MAKNPALSTHSEEPLRPNDEQIDSAIARCSTLLDAWSQPPGKPTKGGVVAVIANASGKELDDLHESGLSWIEIAYKFGFVLPVGLTRAEADWLCKYGGGRWLHRRDSMLIAANFARRLSDLSARLGFDAQGNTARTVGENQSEFGQVQDKCDWIGAYIREQFGKRERREEGDENGNHNSSRANCGEAVVA